MPENRLALAFAGLLQVAVRAAVQRRPPPRLGERDRLESSAIRRIEESRHRAVGGASRNPPAAEDLPNRHPLAARVREPRRVEHRLPQVHRDEPPLLAKPAQLRPFALDRVPAGGNAFAYVTARTQGVLSSSSSYRGQIRVGANGQLYAQIHKLSGNVDTAITPEVALGIAYAPGMAIRVRLSAVGSGTTNLSLRAWPASQPEPAAWTVSGTDSDAALQGAGGVGLRGYEAAAVTNGPAAMSWDDLSVSIATP